MKIKRNLLVFFLSFSFITLVMPISVLLADSKKCGLVEIGVENEGTRSEYKLYKHRCAPKGYLYRNCQISSVKAPNPRRNREYIEVSPPSLYTLKKREIKGGDTYTTEIFALGKYQIKEWICDKEVVKGKLGSGWSKGEERDCGIYFIPAGGGLVRGQHRCAGEGYYFACRYSTWYVDPKAPGTYYRDRSRQRMEAVRAYQCDKYVYKKEN